MAVRVLTTSYPIFSDAKLVIGWLGGGTVVTKNVSIAWNVNNTTVTGAKLIFTVSCDSVLMNDITITFNGDDVFFRTLGAETISGNVDISGTLQNGVNTIAATGFARLHGATLVVTITLQVDFQGEEPSTEPTIGGLPLSTALMIGGGAFIAIMLGIVVGGRKK